MGLFSRKPDDQSATGSNASAADAFGEGSESAPPAPVPAPATPPTAAAPSQPFGGVPAQGINIQSGQPQTIVIQNGQMSEQARAQLAAVGFDPDAFVNQMEAVGQAAKAGGLPATPDLDVDELGEQLTQLKKLHDSGALTDEEYKAAKAKVLG
jgi:hypothetical protein